MSFNNQHPHPIFADFIYLFYFFFLSISFVCLNLAFCDQVDPSGRYENLVTVRSFQPHYRLVGGVNLPKIIDCVGSDGISRRQLVKVSSDTVTISEVYIFFLVRSFEHRVQMHVCNSEQQAERVGRLKFNQLC